MIATKRRQVVLWVELEIGVIGRGIKENEFQCEVVVGDVEGRIDLPVMAISEFPRRRGLTARPKGEVFPVIEPGIAVLAARQHKFLHKGLLQIYLIGRDQVRPAIGITHLYAIIAVGPLPSDRMGSPLHCLPEGHHFRLNGDIHIGDFTLAIRMDPVHDFKVEADRLIEMRDFPSISL